MSSSLPYNEQEWAEHIALLNPFLDIQMNVVRQELIFPKELYYLYLTYLKDQDASIEPMLYATFEYMVEERELPFIKKTPFSANRNPDWLNKLKYLSKFFYINKQLLETSPINVIEIYQLYITYLSDNNVASLAIETTLFISGVRSVTRIYS